MKDGKISPLFISYNQDVMEIIDFDKNIKIEKINGFSRIKE